MLSFCSFDFSKPLSLYIHVPFCLSKCSYCAFYSLPNCSSNVMDKFTDRITEEINLVTSNMDSPFYTAFIGGGNPGCLGFKNLKRIVQSVCKNGRPKEFTTEMNPESLDKSYFELFDGALSRLSLGVQSLSTQGLNFLGRNASLKETLKGLEMSQFLREETGADLSYDMITCLPPFHDYLKDIACITSDWPSSHLSVYALSLEEGTPLAFSNPILPDSDQQYEILRQITGLLTSLGFEHYEVSNYAKSGKQSLHNSVYWAYRQYLGLGPGSASTAFSSENVISRVEGNKNLETYLKNSAFEAYKTEVLTPSEGLEEFLFLGLRCKAGLDLERLEKEFNRKLVLAPPKGFFIKDKRVIADEEGMIIADYAALEILKNLQKC